MPSTELSANQQDVLHRMADAVGMDRATVTNEDALLGFFQAFRPDGRGLEGIFDSLPQGEELLDRLREVFDVAGDDRRRQGGRDAYFVVRAPQPIEPSVAESSAIEWLSQLAELAGRAGQTDAEKRLRGVSKVRVLEGIAPKHPKNDGEKSGLLTVFQKVVPQLASAPNNGLTQLLKTPFYYITCDAMLRDYLMWPFYREQFQMEDPYAAYFTLWKHAVKYRIFQDQQMDLYLPRF